MTDYRVMGIEESEGSPCECCGTSCPKRRVVLRNEDEQDVRFGVSCAAFALTGSKKNGSQVARDAEALTAGRRWLEKFGVASARRGLWDRFSVGSELRDGVFCAWIGGGWRAV